MSKTSGCDPQILRIGTDCRYDGAAAALRSTINDQLLGWASGLRRRP